jgi:pyruvate carboxylase
MSHVTAHTIPMQVAGVNTNIGFLGRLIANKSFQDGDVHTGFIEVNLAMHRLHVLPLVYKWTDSAKTCHACLSTCCTYKFPPRTGRLPMLPAMARLNVSLQIMF